LPVRCTSSAKLVTQKAVKKISFGVRNPPAFSQMAPIILLELKKNHIINLHMLISLRDADLGKSLDQLCFPSVSV
jgi:hypothetical protein